MVKLWIMILSCLIGGWMGAQVAIASSSKFNKAKAIEAARLMGYPAEDNYQFVFSEGARWQSKQ